MTDGLRRGLFGFCAASLALTQLLTACGGSPASSPDTSARATDEGPDVSQMDTGPYMTVPTHPYVTAGDDRFAQGLIESQRIAGATVGPWEINPLLVQRGDLFNVYQTGRLTNAATLRAVDIFRSPLPDIASRHGLLAGFSSLRFAGAETLADVQSPVKFWNLLIAVMRFPTAEDATAAATEMAADEPPPPLASGPRRDIYVRGVGGSLGSVYPLQDGREYVRSFTAVGEFVLYQKSSAVPGQVSGASFVVDPEDLVASALVAQLAKLKALVPTPVDKLPDLPLDPSGFLMSRLLENPSGGVPENIGVWSPQAWVHFEDNPLEAAVWLKDAGVDWVGQRLSTVYRARDAAAAESLLQKIVDQMRRTPPAKPAGEVPGLPRARCFDRSQGKAIKESRPDLERVDWHFKCAAATDRYVFTVYASSQKDAAQRISAQWRILAGK